MKKVLSLILAAMVALCCSAALAQTAAPENAAFEGTWVQFEDGFEIYLPSDWLVMEVTDELSAVGIFYAVTSPDGLRNMQVAWAQNPGVAAVAELKAQFEAAGFTGVQLLPINGIEFVSYEIEQSSSAGMVMLDAKGSMFQFNFFPTSDEAFAPIAQAIMLSIRPLAGTDAQ